jgi:hypothetical protein
MPRMVIRSAAILLLFALFYGVWAAMLPSFEPTLVALAAPLLPHHRLLMALIPVEGLLFGGAFAIAFRGRLPQDAIVPLMVVGGIGNSLVYLACAWAFFLGLPAIVATVALSAVAYFLIAHALTTNSPAKLIHVLLVAAITGLSVAIPWQGAWSFVGLFISKGLWWSAVLGVCALSVASRDRPQEDRASAKSGPV